MISHDVVKEYLDYDEITGHLTWIKKPSKKTMLNSRAGSSHKSSGYRQVYFMGKTYPEHRLIWFWVYGEYPEHEIDHINHIRDDNRLCNLRQVTHAQNCRNRTRQRTRIDEAGIWYCRRRKRYIAEITFNQKKIFQRSFDDIDEAISQRKAKLLELGFHENHGDIK